MISTFQKVWIYLTTHKVDSIIMTMIISYHLLHAYFVPGTEMNVFK